MDMGVGTAIVFFYTMTSDLKIAIALAVVIGAELIAFCIRIL
jgi:hypothetical protein